VLLFVLFIPTLFETHVQAMLDYAPDIAWMLIVGGALALLGIILQAFLLAKWRKQQDSVVSEGTSS